MVAVGIVLTRCPCILMYRLLEQGFRKEIVKILSALPDRKKQPRQTLLVSLPCQSQVDVLRLTQFLTPF